jgi:hypothetical protein
MLGGGIPELEKREDVAYLKKKMYLGLSDVAASAAFAQLIKESINSTRTNLNNLAHNLK